MWSKVSKPVLVRNIAITGTENREWGWVWGLMLTSAGRVWVSPQVVQSLGSILAFLCCSSSLGVAYTSECFPCKPGTYADQKGSSCCKLCPANSYSNKGETSCHQCDPDKYSGDVSEGGKSLVGGVPTYTQGQTGSGTILLAKLKTILLKHLLSGPWKSPPNPPITLEMKSFSKYLSGLYYLPGLYSRCLEYFSEKNRQGSLSSWNLHSGM